MQRARTARTENAPCWSATSCSPTDSLRSTIGARGLNFRVRNGTGCTSPAMVADQQGAFFGFQGGGPPRVPSGPHSVTRTSFAQQARIDPEPKKVVKRRARPISTARLNASRRLHLQPIASWSTRGLTEGKTHLGMGFPLRCFQRLSRPDTATERCHWLTTRTPEVRPPRSSRTKGSLPQFSYAHGG